ncbi:MAG: aminodeoxychorismate synthase component I [Candidatus Omnitrophica bacterium]|nr:aminodeoxychorismate synthase component I [Candidatus Omnitrophota bacterium]
MLKKLDGFLCPESAYSVFKDESYSAFLDSGMDEGKLGRFSFICHDPFMVVRSKGRHLRIETGNGTVEIQGDPLKTIDEILAFFKSDERDEDIPFTSGCVGYFSYDLRYFVENLPSISIDDLGMPDIVLCFYDIIIIFDNLKREVYISSSGLPFIDAALREGRSQIRFEEVLRRLKELEPKEKRDKGLRHSIETDEDNQGIDSFAISNFSKEEYFDAIEKAKELIARGDIYQVNLSQRFECEYKQDPYKLYLVLREINPAPFAAYLNCDDFKIISASPERFVKIIDRYIETRPIKGTRPRGGSVPEDMDLRDQLIHSPKDRAEHVMIVDLERNDLGRVCEYGTVRPTEFIILESYATVHHLVSTIAGRLRPTSGIIQCLKNCFPGGSITGAPKVRAMEVIEELEPTKRGIYTGSIGYIDFSGNADLSIVIRTIVINKGRAYFQVGGGIVADSIAEKEYNETLDKATALVRAIKIVKDFKAQQQLTGKIAISG